MTERSFTIGRFIMQYDESNNSHNGDVVVDSEDLESRNGKNPPESNGTENSAHNSARISNEKTSTSGPARDKNGHENTDVQSPFLPQLKGRDEHSSSQKKSYFAFILIGIIVIALAIGYFIFAPHHKKEHNSELTIGLKLAPANLDIRNQSGTALDQLLIGNVYEGLVSRDQNNHIVPALAKKWTVSHDGLDYTFTLHKNMKFANGDPLTAKDAAWSIQELLKKQYRGAQLLTMIKDVKAEGKDKLTLHLSRPYADLLWMLSGRPGLVFDPNAHINMKTQALGSGPYVIADFKPNSSVTLKKNKNYWGMPAHIDTVHLRYFVDDNAGLNALKSKSIDVLSPINPFLGKAISADKNYTIAPSEDTDKMVLAMNNRKDVFKDKRVRQAIRYAINHKEIIKTMGSFDKLLGGPIPSLDPGYEDLNGLYPYNPQKARELLKEAGYSNTHPLNLSLMYPTIYSQQLGRILRSQLHQVGINLNVRVVEFSTWLEQVYTKKDYDLSLVDHNESHDFYQWANPHYYYGYDNKMVQQLYKEAMTSADPHTTVELLKKAARTVSEDAAADWLYNFRVVNVISKRVKNYPLNSNQVRLFLSQISLEDK